MCQSGTIRGRAASYNFSGTYVVVAGAKGTAVRAILSHHVSHASSHP
jgi:hypothetical protein